MLSRSVIFHAISSYLDSEFLIKQQNLDLLPIGYKLKLTDLVLFHKIVYKTVQIAMPNYIFQLTKDSVPNTKKNAEIYNGSDELVFGCSVRPRVNAFRYSFFPRMIFHSKLDRLNVIINSQSY